MSEKLTLTAGWEDLSHYIKNSTELADVVSRIVNDTAITDMHTHLYAPPFGLLLQGIDEQLRYHYLISEVMRHSPLSSEEFWAMSNRKQADHMWQVLFLEHSPYSEACRGVLTTLEQLGLDVKARNLERYREWYSSRSQDAMVDLVFHKANVKEVVMTNDPFDEAERSVWLSDTSEAIRQDERFHAALRLDPLLNDWAHSHQNLLKWGYDVKANLTEYDRRTFSEVNRFLREWLERMNALYLSVSLPSTFTYPSEDERSLLITHCVIPTCAEANVPLALMIGVKRQVNPKLGPAGDMVGRSDVEAVEHLCRAFPRNRFLVTMLSRENQHELTVLARMFPNLMVFGAWWFLNTPSLVEEITQMRFELLGTSVIPQHSDARILEQLLYKWSHARQVIASVLSTQYQKILDTGWPLDTQDIERDAADLLSNNFWRFVKKN